MGKIGIKTGKNDEKNGTQASEADKIPDVSIASRANDTGVSQKLDTLLEAVKNMGDQLKQQDERLRRQEERQACMTCQLFLQPTAPQSTRSKNLWPLNLTSCHLLRF